MSSSHGGEIASRPREGLENELDGIHLSRVRSKTILIEDITALRMTLRGPHGDVPVTSEGLPTWAESDDKAFESYSTFTNSLRYVVVPNDDTRELGDTVDRFHATMPFSQGERRWFHDVYGEATKLECDVPGFSLPEILADAEATIISNGLHQIVRGRELMRRWAAWRRQTDEFAGQGTLSQAQRYVDKIENLVLRDHNPEAIVSPNDTQA
jgi:hypothetical protein